MEPEARPYTWVDDDAGLGRLLEHLAQEPAIALDTESNSLHAYRERVCLVQLSVPDADFLIDPLAVDIRPLGAVLADPQRQKIFHAADYDILSLRRAYNFDIENLFDTMLAARVLGWPSYGLAAILEEHFGHRSNKRFQRYDWGQRPISDQALSYAQADTRFLVKLRNIQLEMLKDDPERLGMFEHACLRQSRVIPKSRPFSPEDFWRIKGVRELDDAGRAVLRELFVFRETLGQRKDRPVFRIANDALLVELAARQPTDLAALRKVKGVPRAWLGRGGQALFSTIAKGQQAPVPEPPPRTGRQPRAVTTRFDALRTWRKSRADKSGVEPDIVLSKDTLLAIAVAQPSDLQSLAALPELDAWEHERYGTDLLAVLGGYPPDS